MSILAQGKPDPAAQRRWVKGGVRVVDLKCDGCGEEYLEYKGRAEKAKRHFCSAACYQAAKAGRLNPHWKGGKLERACKHCGIRFAVAQCRPRRKGRPEGIYCSSRCKVRAQTIYKTPLDSAREARRRRDARKRASRNDLGSHTTEEWEDLKRRSKYRCLKCKKKRALTRDHIIPLSKGGCDRITNIQPLCRSCNSKKYTKVETLL